MTTSDNQVQRDRSARPAGVEVLAQELIRVKRWVGEDAAMDGIAATLARMATGFVPDNPVAYARRCALNAHTRRARRTPVPVDTTIDNEPDTAPGPEEVAMRWEPGRSGHADECEAAAAAVFGMVPVLEEGRLRVALRVALRYELQARKPARYAPTPTGAQSDATAKAVTRRLPRAVAAYHRFQSS